MFQDIKYIETYQTLESTKDLSEKYILEKKYNDHFLIIAESQSQGKGRKGNDWLSPVGGLWFNLVLKFVSEQKSFTLFAGYCVLKSLIELFEIYFKSSIISDFKIKWPNDIYLFEKKICGLICSQYFQFGMTNIGIGINTNIRNMPELKYDSILNLLNKEIDNKIYLTKIINKIFENLPIYEAKGLSLFNDYYKEHDFLKNKQIKIISGIHAYDGLYQGIDTDGALLLKEKDETIRTIYSGSVF